jgi:hypothetical protein
MMVHIQTMFDTYLANKLTSTLPSTNPPAATQAPNTQGITATATEQPVPTPTAAATEQPVPTPTAAATEQPVPTPTAAATEQPVLTPTAAATEQPVPTPTAEKHPELLSK